MTKPDAKILQALIKDARAKIKDIAKSCNISSVSVLKRIKRLKAQGVITGATLYPSLPVIGLIIAHIGINIKGNQNKEVFDFIGEQTKLIEPSISIGKYDLCAFVAVENMVELDRVAYGIKKRFGANRIEINVWASVVYSLENIDLQPQSS